MRYIFSKGYIKSAQHGMGMETIPYNFAEGKTRAKGMSIESLQYAIKDLKEVIAIQDQAQKQGHNMPKLGLYFDELHTYAEELRSRSKTDMWSHGDHGNDFA